MRKWKTPKKRRKELIKIQIDIKITEDASKKPECTDEDAEHILEIAKKYRLDLLGSWLKIYGGAIFLPYEEQISAKGLRILSHLLAGEMSVGVPTEEFTGKVSRWTKIVQHYDFSKFRTLDLSLISGALLAIWERVRMNVYPEGYIVMGGEPAYCPLYEPARSLDKIVREGNAIAFELNRCEPMEMYFTQKDRGL